MTEPSPAAQAGGAQAGGDGLPARAEPAGRGARRQSQVQERPGGSRVFGLGLFGLGFGLLVSVDSR